jgi:hypothetical protein
MFFQVGEESRFHAPELKVVDLEDCGGEGIEGVSLYIKTRERLERRNTSVCACSNEENPSSYTPFALSNPLTLLLECVIELTCSLFKVGESIHG